MSIRSTTVLHQEPIFFDYYSLSDQKWWQDCVTASKPKNQPAEKQPAQAARGRGGPVRGPARGGPTARGRGTPARGAPAARGRGGVGATRGGGPVGRGRGNPAKPTAAASNSKCEKPEAPKPTEVCNNMHRISNSSSVSRFF